MPDWYDPFNLVIYGSAEARVETENISVGSGDSFVMTFHYAGGFNPVATGFEVHWFTTLGHQAEGEAGNNANALTAGDSRIPTQVTISPRIPEAGADTTSPGELRGTAPTLGTREENRTLYGVMTILQAALNN